MTDPRIAALAEALMWHLDVDPCEGVAWGTADSVNDLAAAILAALDGWDLVRVDDLGRQIVGLYMVERDEALATIATLRAALDGLREPLGEWLVEMMERNLTPAEATLYDALRAALAAAKENR